jgi:carbon monoxide dehydrogenase subunit G
MELSNEFVVPVGIDEAWGLLTDVERIAPCMPGAQLTEIEGDEYRGLVKVKVGPITAQYKGKATFVEKDDSSHKAVLRAEGRDTRGQGNAHATVTATLVPEGAGTRVTVVTDLAITGRAAQFGRGIMADVSTKLLGQFVSCLEKNVLGSDGGPPAWAAAEESAASAPAASSTGSETPAAASAASPKGEETAAAAAASSKGEEAAAAAPAASAPAQESAAQVGAGREGGAAAAAERSGATPSGPVTRAAGGASDAALAGGMSGSNGSASAPEAPPTVSSGPRAVESRPAEAVDLLGTAGSPLIKRLLPAFVGALAAFIIGRRLRRLRRG